MGSLVKIEKTKSSKGRIVPLGTPVETKMPETQIASPASGIVKQPTMAQLQQQRQQAQVDLDVNRVNELDKQMKAMRAAERKQTFGDRLSDVFSGATSASGGNLVNAAGTVVNAYQDADSNRRQAQRLRDSIAKGYTTDGKPISEAMRKTMEQSIAKLEADAAKWEQETSAANRLYKAADTLQETSREQVASAKEGLGAVGQFAVDAGVGAMQLAGDIAANVIVPGAGTAMLAARSFGGAAQEARQSGADIGDQLGYGIGSAAASVLTEKLTNLAGPFKKAFGGGVLDDVLDKVSSKPAGKLIVSALSEGGEEMLESAMQPVLQRLTYDPEAAYDSEWLAETLYSGAVGAVLGGLGGGVDVITNPQSNAQESRAEVKDPNWQATLQTIAPEKREAFTQAKVIAERFGTPLNIAGIANGAAGEYLSGTITIDPNAANPARQVLIHELTHHMETSGLYREFSNMVMAKVNEMGVDVAAMRNDLIDSYAKNGVQIGELGADKEIVAKFAEDMLFKDEKSVQRLLETDRNLFQRIYDWIRDAVRKLGKNPEQRFLIDAQNLYEKALRKAGQQAGTGVAQNTFAGENARTANLEALQTAQRMEAQGENAEAIRQATGWYRGMDKKWRFEIDDSGMQYFGGGDALFRKNHPEYAKYRSLMEDFFAGELEPEQVEELQELDLIWGREYGRLSDRVINGEAKLNDIIQHDELFKAYPELNDTKILFSDVENKSGYYVPGLNQIVLSRDLKNEPESTLIHEIQHAVQDAAGFTQGSSPGYWEAVKNVNEATARELYFNTAGEIEARDAEARQIWTPEQRMATMPALGNENTVFAEWAEKSEKYMGKTADGTEVYVTSKKIKALPWKDRKKLFLDLMKNQYRGRTARFNANGDVLYARFDEKDLNKNIYGDKKSSPAGIDAKINVGADGNIFDLVENAKYKSSAADTGKKGSAHKNLTGWEYFIKTVQIDGQIFDLLANVRKKADGEYVYSIQLNENNKKSASPVAVPANSSPASEWGTTDNKSIRAETRKVKDPFDIVPRLFDEEFSMGPSFKQLVRTQKGDPFDIVPKLNEIIGETNEAGEAGLTPETLPTKARNKLQKTERTLVNQIGNALSVPYTAKRDYLQGIVREMSAEYLATGKVSRETMNRLFETAYEQGIVVDTEYYDQYKALKDELRTRPVAISDADKADIADYNDFRKSTMGTLLISNSGTPVDILYGELSERYPALFPRDIYAPGDQLQRLFEVGKGIQKVEHTLDGYYGADAATFKAFAKREFEDAATNAIRDFKEVRRWTEEQIEKRARQMAYTPDMLKNAYANIRRARKAREKALSQELLTDSDKALLKRLEAGEITVDDLKPGRDNVRGIRKVYEASQEYNQWNRVIKEYKKELNQKRRAEADAELGTMIGWKDKSAGILYSRETMERNLRDIAPDKETADRIYNKYFKPVKDSNAAATRAKNDFRNRVRKLNLNRKPTNGNKVSEAYAVQFVGEAEDNIRMLEESTERNAKRDGMTLQEWKAEVTKFWQENPNMDKAKINESVQEFRSIYDELFQKMNEVRVRNGYEPVAYRKGYFPHFQEGESGLLTNFAQALGITADVTNLPTSINGLTHTFRPGMAWFGHAQERKGFKTDYDAVKGFDKYIEGAADVIYQTDNIQNLRALAHQIRYNTTDEGIKAQVDNVRANENLNEDQKYNEIEKIYEDGQFALSNFVVELEEYTNLLANKKSRADRNMESLIGRRAYNVVKGLERRVAANMVAINPGSWLTNFIPITQGMASLDTRSLLQGMWDTLKAYKEPDGMVEVSSFLTNRRGSDPIAKTWAQEASAWLSKPMEYIDGFTADTLVRARYNQNVKNGMNEVDALNEADKWAAGVMADRSKGSMPTLFERSNPLTKLFTQFQLEVNNQYSFLFKDLPDDLKKKGAAAMTAALLKMFMGAWLYNEVYEHLVGRRPALDPLGILNDTVGDFTGYELPNMVDLAGEAISGDLDAEDFQTEKTGTYEAVTNAGGQIVEQLPFIGGLAGGGRLPISSALPNFQNLGKALFSDDWAPEKKLATIGKELSAPLYYIAPPAGGGLLKKWVQGIKAAKEGGSYSVNSKGEKLLQYPIYSETEGDIAQNVVRMGLFGKSALPQAQDWVESGFDSLGAKETQVYQGLTEAGVGQREAFQFLQDFGKVEKTETESAATRKRRALKDSNLSDEAKSMVFYGLLASDTEQETLDRMAEADFAGAAAAIMNLKDANLLKGTTATKAERAAIMNANVSDRAKMDLYTKYVSDSKQDEIEAVLDAGLTFDDWLTFEYRTAGLGSDQSKTKKEKVMDVIQNMNITPEQKDALYLTGYEASGLKDAPWHKGLTVPQIGATIFERPKLELPELKIPKLW